METRAIVIPATNRVELQQVTLTEPTEDDVLVQTAFTSISAGTERMLLAGRMPHPMLSFPVIPGYETVGRIVEGGANVPAEMMGQWVYVGGARCYEGVNSAWGGQAQRLYADHRRVVPLGDLLLEQGVLLALAATALHGIDLLNLQAGQRVLVLGQGPVGQIAARLARQKGAWVAVADKVESRLAIAEGDLMVNVAEQSVAQAITPQVDIIIEATGSMMVLTEALPTLATDGTILLLGYYDTLNLPYMPLFLKQAKLLTAREWAAGDLIRCRDLISGGQLNVASLLTHRLTIKDLQQAYHEALENPDCLKVVLQW
jgi:3-hydroxyethyl bacteriochlorophyllide a dehydrogenase